VLGLLKIMPFRSNDVVDGLTCSYIAALIKFYLQRLVKLLLPHSKCNIFAEIHIYLLKKPYIFEHIVAALRCRTQLKLKEMT
jgi:hypothetical protein